MARTVSIGEQYFDDLISGDCFYIDKTAFIKEWWESRDKVTLITRPRRFGKTLNMSMLERFFSVQYSGQGSIFENLDIWQEEKYREIQGSWPVIFLSFALIKEKNYPNARAKINEIFVKLYAKYSFLKTSGLLDEKEIEYYNRVSSYMNDSDATLALHQMSDFLSRYYGKKVIILLDEYDTPMQEAYVSGYWDEMAAFTRGLFNAAFKTNPYMERAVMTGVTRVSKESLFSDLNNLQVITTTSEEYARCFGFTEEEVFAAMDEFGLTNKEEVKKWYDGFIIGSVPDIYNPWSITNFLKKGKLKTYWANTSSNGLVDSLLRKGSGDIKMQFEELLHDRSIKSKIDEEIVFNQLDRNENAIWSLLLASGYLKVVKMEGEIYTMNLTNYEVCRMFKNMVSNWFDEDSSDYNEFIKALLLGDVDAMNDYMNELTEAMFSTFCGEKNASRFSEGCVSQPALFYHGFVLGLLVDLRGRYEVTSNRESGFGRYDVMLYPLNQGDDGITNNSKKDNAITNNSKKDNAIIMEFKVYNPRRESCLEETVQSALRQIEEKKYEQTLIDRGIDRGRIRKYGFAFEGKNVLIG